MCENLPRSTTVAPTASQASKGSLQFVATAKSSTTSATKWRAASVPTHGGAKACR